MDTPEDVLSSIREAMNAQDYVRAENELKAASKRWKNEPEFAVRHAGVLVKLGRDKEALKVYRKVMKKAPERLDACRGAAQSALSLGKAKLAEKLFSRATGLGLNLDEAALGIARCMLLRRHFLDAWKKAEYQFKESGNRHRGLHEFLVEIAPQVGLSTPRLDEFDSVSLHQIQDEVRRDTPDQRLQSHNFAAGSLEAMAGVDRGTLVDADSLDSGELLGGSKIGQGSTNLGIDLSLLTESSSAPIAESGSQQSLEADDNPAGPSTDSAPPVEVELDLDGLTEAAPATSQVVSSPPAEQNPALSPDADPWDDWP